MPREDIPPEEAGTLRRLDLVSLRLFEAVAETGSLSAACARLNLALAAGSRRLSDLEAALGVRLAERDRSGTRLTPAGEAALARWRLAAEGLRRMVLESRDAAEGVRGQLRLAASSSVVVQFLPAALSGFLPRHPHLRLDLRETTSRDAGAALRDGSVDLALMDLLHVPAGCEHRPWQEDRLSAVLPRGHPLLAGSPKRLPFAALLGHDLVGLDPGTALHAAMRGAAEAAGQELRLRVKVYSFEAVALLVGAGLGLSVLPEGAVRRPEALGLALVPLADPWARRRHVLAARRFDALAEPARLFAAHLQGARGLRAARRQASRKVR
jgi:DNA-binding transcriptional LysR family regulator